jgi:hypothetical protein
VGCKKEDIGEIPELKIKKLFSPWFSFPGKFLGDSEAPWVPLVLTS